MDWNPDRIITAPVAPAGAQDPDSDNAIIERFQEFFHEYPGPHNDYPYRTEIEERRAREDFWIELDLEDLRKHREGRLVDLVEEVKKTPGRYLSLLNEAARREAVAVMPADSGLTVPRFFVTLRPPTLDKTVSIREISDESVGSLIAVRGLVLQSSRVSCAISDAVIQCRSCHSIKTIHIDPITILANGGRFQLPRTCDNTTANAASGRGFELTATGARPLKCGLDPYMLQHAQSTFVDFQTINLQERHEDLTMGDIPRHIRVVMQRTLVNRLKPGMNVTVYGILQASSAAVSDDASVNFKTLAVVGVRDDSTQTIGGTGEELGIPRSLDQGLDARMHELSQIPNLIDLITASIEPAIYGHTEIKEAIAAMLFGGRRTVLPDGMRIRGDINVLLLGDPGTAKSQFLKFVNQVAPLCVFTSGKGSSAAGLTASVIREPATNEWYLEGGAMVLADGGVVCIDEFDKMNDEDRVAIHEAMEQQTISIAKAGITTMLNSRCSVLAAANPVFGSFDDLRSAAENIDFQTTILSRFDLIFLIRDTIDQERDKAIAAKVVALRQEDQVQDPRLISIGHLKQYIDYARRTCFPVLTDEASRVLQNGYVELRSRLEERTRTEAAAVGVGVSRANKHIPITVRQLEALIRLSQAFARMCLQKEVTAEHARRALSLFRKANDMSIQQTEGRPGGRPGAGPAESDSVASATTAVPGFSAPDVYRRVENEIRMQLRVGTDISYAVLADNISRLTGTDPSIVRRVVEAMIAREELDQRAGGRRVYRKR